jgi:hypothetical protein
MRPSGATSLGRLSAVHCRAGMFTYAMAFATDRHHTTNRRSNFSANGARHVFKYSGFVTGGYNDYVMFRNVDTGMMG